MKQRKNILKSYWQSYSWQFLSGFGLFIYIIGVIGFYIEQPEKNLMAFFNSLYLSLQLFTIDSGSKDISNWWFNIARFAAPAIIAFSSIKAFYGLFMEQLVLSRVRKWKNHIVICGLGSKGLFLLGKYFSDNNIIIIEKNKEHPEIPSCKARGIPVIIGDASDEVLLERTNFYYAKKIFVITGDDLSNIKTVQIIKDKVQCRNLRDSIYCYVHLHNNDIKREMENFGFFTSNLKCLSVLPFNIFEESARKIFNDYPPDKDIYIEKEPHIMVFGFGTTGESIVKQSIRMGVYHKKKINISVVDKFAEKQRLKFLSMYEHPEKKGEFIFRNANLKFIQLDVLKDIIYDLGSLGIKSKDEIPSKFFVALGNDNQSLQFALILLNIIKKSAEGMRNFKIFICMNEVSSDIVFPDENLKVLNIKEMGCKSILEIDKIDTLARLIHSSYCVDKFYEEKSINLTPEMLEYLSDKDYFYKEKFIRESFANQVRESIRKKSSLKPWEELDEIKRDSNRLQADHIEIKLRTLNPEFNLSTDISLVKKAIEENIEILAEMEHNRWCAENFLMGKKNLKEYKELDEKDKKWNREIVEKIPILVETLQKIKDQKVKM